MVTRQELEIMLARGGAKSHGEPSSPKRKSKYNAERVEIDGIKFASKHEAEDYVKFKQLQAAGKILYFLMQVPFLLPGGIKYLCDFQIFWSDGRIEYFDSKGFKTDVFIIKKKQVEALYPVKITEI